MKKMMSYLTVPPACCLPLSAGMLARRLMPEEKEFCAMQDQLMDYLGSLMPMLTVSFQVLM